MLQEEENIEFATAPFATLILRWQVRQQACLARPPALDGPHVIDDGLMKRCVAQLILTSGEGQTCCRKGAPMSALEPKRAWSLKELAGSWICSRAERGTLGLLSPWL